LSRNRAVKSSRHQTMTKPQENTINFNQPKPARHRPIDLVPRTRNQERLILALQDPDQSIVVTAGPAGTGKTYLCTLAAVQALRAGTCKKIVLTRPAVEVEEEKHGFLPGDLNQKMMPWCIPLLDVLKEYYRESEVAAMMDDGVIEIAPLAFMRGRTMKDAWIIADESQNMTPKQMVMLLTRIGENSKIAITGDTDQTDRRKGNNGLVDLCERLMKGGVKGIAVCGLDNRDIQRHPIIADVLQLYAD